jgi:hypothetical protein
MTRYQKLMALVVFSSLSVYAAENDVAAPEEEQQTEVASEDPGRPLEENITEPDGEIILDAIDENFVPSEQITEDLPVAFPIDI